MAKLYTQVQFTNPIETPVQKSIYQTLEANGFRGYVSQEQAQALKAEHGLTDQELYFAMLPFAANYAEPTISKFYVGAIVKDLDGNFYFGGNMEMEGMLMQYTVHAEQCAINHAYLSGARGVEAIIVNYSPCGHCRQFINELNTAKDLKIYLPQIPDGAPLSHYLPDSFGPADLEITDRLFDNNTNVSRYSGLTLEEVIEKVRASRIGYSPYSNSESFCILQTNDNNYYVGRYIENAAYNPSFPIINSALALARMYNEDSANFKLIYVEENNTTPLPVAKTVEGIANMYGIDFKAHTY